MIFPALVAKELRLLARNRALLAALVLYPAVLAGVLGAAFTEPPARFDVAVVNGDAKGARIDLGDGQVLTSETLVNATARAATVLPVASEAEALALVRQAKVDAAILIPKGFVAGLAGIGGRSNLTLVVDEADAVRAAVARSALEGAVASFTKSVVEKKVDDVLRNLDLAIEGGTVNLGIVGSVDVLGLDRTLEYLVEVRSRARGEDAARLDAALAYLAFARTVLAGASNLITAIALPVEAQTRGVVSEPLRLRDVVLPGTLVLGAFWTGALAAAALAGGEREGHVRLRLASSPTPLSAHAAAKGAAALLVVLAEGLLLAGVALASWGAFIADPALALLALVLSGAAAAALGGLCAEVARGASGASLLVVLALLPMMLLGGLFYPVAYLPEGAQAVANALPMTRAVEALRGAMLRGSPFAEVAPDLLALAGFAAACALAAALLGRRRREES